MGYSCCIPEQTALEDFIDFLKQQKGNQCDGIVLVFYTEDKTFTLLLSKMKFYGMSHQFLSLVTGFTSMTCILGRMWMEKTKKSHDTSDIETLTNKILGKPWPETPPFLDLISYFMWEILCHTIFGDLTFDKFIKDFCKPLALITPVDVETHRDGFLNQLTHIELDAAFRTIKSTRIELQHIDITVLSDSERSEDSDSG